MSDEEFAQLQARAKRGMGNAPAVRKPNLNWELTGISEATAKPPKRSKYGVDVSPAGKAARMRDGILFASKREARRYDELKLLVKARQVAWFIRQPSFDLPGGVRYRADFLVVWNTNVVAGRVVTVEDAKGCATKVYAMKVKQVKAIYGVDIQEV